MRIRNVLFLFVILCCHSVVASDWLDKQFQKQQKISWNEEFLNRWRKTLKAHHDKDYIASLPEDFSTSPSEITKTIHFIWLGGPIKEDYWRNIIIIASHMTHEGFATTVWVDDKNDLRVIKKLHSDAQHDFKKDYFESNEFYDLYVNKLKIIRVESIYSLLDRTKELFAFMYDSDDEVVGEIYAQIFWRYVLGEMVGLKNYAAASDLLRYLILALFGGVYLDVDLKPISFPRHNDLNLDVRFNHQFKDTFGHITNNNCLIFSCRKHPKILKALARAFKNYSKYEFNVCADFWWTPFDLKRLHQFQGFGFQDGEKHFCIKPNEGRLILTCMFSGPGVLDKDTRTELWVDKEMPLIPQRIDTEINNKFIEISQKMTLSSLKKNYLGCSTAMKKTRSLNKKINSLVFLKSLKWSNLLNKKMTTNELNDLIKEIHKSKRYLIPIFLGNLVLEYRCDNTWLDQENPSHGFTTDDLPSFIRMSSASIKEEKK